MTLDTTDVVETMSSIDEPDVPALELAERLADATDTDTLAAQDIVYDALDDGVLVEEGDGYGGVRLTEEYDSAETPETPKTDANEGGEAAAGDETPTHEARGSGKELAERSLEAFGEAISFFNDQLETEIADAFEGAPKTPRQYYLEHREWTEETISSKQLGYAPADPNALREHLMSEGFDGDAMQGTGLFYTDFSPHFQGRYVLPYFQGGRPVYAISRSLNAREDGHPRDPKGKQKYTKAIKTKDRTYVDEPIYGGDTVGTDTDRLLVAGGIADAITLHQAGYACVSPVTTVRFKSKHEESVVDLVTEYDLDGVYMLNDAERPSVDATELEDGEKAAVISEVLTIKQYGEGLRGAFGNAEFLLEEDIDPYLVALPSGDGDLRKLDPDDYVKENWGTVETVLRSARHAEHHAGYRTWRRPRQDTRNGQGVTAGSASSGDAPATGGSRLWDLTLSDVSGVSPGERVDNPLGHHGDSHGYFVVFDGETGYDHKYNVTYNALTFALCDAGERRDDDPEGPLSDWEVFAAWKHAKKHGLLNDSDPVPYRGMLGVAVEEGIVSADELVTRDSETGDVVENPNNHDASTYRALPPGTYNSVLMHAEERHDINLGRDPVETGDRPSTSDFAGEEEDPAQAAQDFLAMLELTDK
jgi:hypothetical protein